MHHVAGEQQHVANFRGVIGGRRPFMSLTQGQRVKHQEIPFITPNTGMPNTSWVVIFAVILPSCLFANTYLRNTTVSKQGLYFWFTTSKSLKQVHGGFATALGEYIIPEAGPCGRVKNTLFFK